MNAFSAVLDWGGEQLSFQKSTTKIPAIHRRTSSQAGTADDAAAHISVVALDSSVGAVPGYLPTRCCVPPPK